MSYLFAVLNLLFILNGNVLDVEKGVMTYYSSGVFDRVYAKRIGYKQITPCKDCIGYVAVRDCDYLNEYAYIYTKKRGMSGPYHIIDCSGNPVVHKKTGLLVEIPYELAMKWKVYKPEPDVFVIVTERKP